MYRVKWNAGDSYKIIAESYANFVLRNYGLATEVFDGYNSGPSIKENTHNRRGSHNVSVRHISEDMTFTGKRDEFLKNKSNKSRIIDMINRCLTARGCRVQQATGDADVDIVLASVAASRICSTTVIGEDTDLVPLLLHYSQNINSHEKLYYRSDKNVKNSRIWDVYALKECLGEDLCSQLLFIHAFTGCDNTSRIFSIGKQSALKSLQTFVRVRKRFFNQIPIWTI